jgi:hypothetical protein
MTRQPSIKNNHIKRRKEWRTRKNEEAKIIASSNIPQVPY